MKTNLLGSAALLISAVLTAGTGPIGGAASALDPIECTGCEFAADNQISVPPSHSHITITPTELGGTAGECVPNDNGTDCTPQTGTSCIVGASFTLTFTAPGQVVWNARQWAPGNLPGTGTVVASGIENGTGAAEEEPEYAQLINQKPGCGGGIRFSFLVQVEGGTDIQLGHYDILCTDCEVAGGS